MGNNSSRRGSSPEEVSERRPKRRRRLRDVGGGVDDVASDEESEEGAISPKRARIQATSTYIYETLYQQGIGTDITLIALEKEWKLHKVYLCQSRYFASMFSGNWKESDQSIIHLDIPDPNITEECLNIAFTSLYKDSIHLSSSLIPGIVAAATMFQLDGLLQHCIEYMKETLCSAHMLKYLNTASQYGLHDIEKKCQDWLQTRLLTDFTIPLLLDMSLELLTELIKSPDLFVLQVETDVYSLAKKWLFLHLNPTWDGSLSKLTSSAEAFYREKSEGVYLETEEGRQYQELFRSIRLRHIINDSASVAVLENDKIIPQDWLLPLYRHQWLKMVTVDQRLDHGPVSLTKDDFNDNAIRCGRILQKSDEYCWRWTGFLFGVDILLIYKDGLISVKRNTRSQPCLAAVSLQNERSLTFRLRVVSFSKNEEVCSSQDTGIVHLTLAPDETAYILTVDKQVKFPLYISFNFSLTSSNINLT